MADLEDEVVLCASCSRRQRFMKRCAACGQVFYCSKECQVRHWQYHKPFCQDFKEDCQYSAVPSTEIPRNNTIRQESKVNVSPDFSSSTSPLKTPLPMNGSPRTNEFNKQDEFQELRTSINDSSASQAGCRNDGENPDASNELSNLPRVIPTALPGGNRIAEDDFGKETVTILIKHNKMKHELCLPTTENVQAILQVISDAVSIPVSKLKLVHKGKMATRDNIQEMLINKALFLALGEVCESEDGLEKTEIDLIVKQLDVDRNLAVKVLRKTGNVLDAIIEIGNM